MKADLPKQFITLQGKPVLMRTIDRFVSALKSNVSIVLVLPEDQIDFWKELCAEHDFKTAHQIVVGGKTRFDSVKNGLKSIKGEGMVAIHDGVRPLLSKNLIENLFKSALKKNNAIPCIHLKDSIRKVTDNNNKSLNRKNYVLIQTPQVFDYSDIKKAYDQKFDKKFTDDANVFETLNKKINLIKGEERNFKITTKNDLKLAKKYLGN